MFRKQRKFAHDKIPFDWNLLKRIQHGTVGLANYAMSMVLSAYHRLQDEANSNEVQHMRALMEEVRRVMECACCDGDSAGLGPAVRFQVSSIRRWFRSGQWL